MTPVCNPLPVNQYFHYDPVRGLQYFSGPCKYLVTTKDMELTSYGYRSLIEHWIDQVYEFGIAPIGYVVEPISRILSNFNI